MPFYEIYFSYCLVFWLLTFGTAIAGASKILNFMTLRYFRVSAKGAKQFHLIWPKCIKSALQCNSCHLLFGLMTSYFWDGAWGILYNSYFYGVKTSSSTCLINIKQLLKSVKDPLVICWWPAWELRRCFMKLRL